MVLHVLDIKKTRTPYHPQNDGMVDHMNYKIHDMLAKHVAEHQRDWDVHLPMVMMAYQSSVHSFTQYTTHDLNWTRSAITLGCYAWLWASSAISSHWVCKEPQKLHLPWHGPHVIVKKISDVTYQIKEVDNWRKRRVVHFNRLKLCGESIDQQTAQPTGQPSSSTVQKPHLALCHVEEKTDLMYADETIADGNKKLTRTDEEDPTEAELRLQIQ